MKNIEVKQAVTRIEHANSNDWEELIVTFDLPGGEPIEYVRRVYDDTKKDFIL